MKSNRNTTQALVAARQNYVDAFNTLASIRYQVKKVSINDLMLAYYVAREWQKWFTDPQADGCPLEDKELSYSDQKQWMTDYVATFEDMLLNQRSEEVISAFAKLNPTLVAIAKDKHARPTWYIEVLRLTAELFKANGRPELADKVNP